MDKARPELLDYMDDAVTSLGLNDLLHYVNQQRTIMKNKDKDAQPNVVVARSPGSEGKPYQAMVMVRRLGEYELRVEMRGFKAADPRTTLMYLLVEIEKHIFTKTTGQE